MKHQRNIVVKQAENTTPTKFLPDENIRLHCECMRNKGSKKIGYGNGQGKTQRQIRNSSKQNHHI